MTAAADRTAPGAEAAAADGPQAAPFRQFVLKISSRCNLACDYCYVYEMADQSWRSRPVLMSEQTVERTALRIAEHARAHALPRVGVVLHGGEPLLAGPRRIAEVVAAIRRAAAPQVEVACAVQTNGVLLDRASLDLFVRLGVTVGVSVDGGPAAHDRHRRHRSGRGSYDDVRRSVSLLRSEPYRRLFAGVLCVIDLASDPLDVYQALLDLGAPAADLLLPDGNWTSPPPGRSTGSGETPYADWLIAVFDAWYRSPDDRMRIRLFEEVIHLVLGGRGATEALGSTRGSVVVEADGAIEQTDALKAAYHGAAATSLNVADHSFDLALRHPAFAARRLGAEGLSGACRACPVLRVCGGGHYAHRYRAGGGFRNPSVYCPDLRRLIEHVRGVVRGDVRTLLADLSAGHGGGE